MTAKKTKVSTVTTSNSTPNYDLPIWEGEDVTSWMGQLNDAMEKIDSGIHEAALAGDATEIKNQIKTLHNQVVNNTDDIDTLKDNVIDMGADIRLNAQHIEEVQSDINNVNVAINSINTQVNSLDARVETIEDNVKYYKKLYATNPYGAKATIFYDNTIGFIAVDLRTSQRSETTIPLPKELFVGYIPDINTNYSFYFNTDNSTPASYITLSESAQMINVNVYINEGSEVPVPNIIIPVFSIAMKTK